MVDAAAERCRRSELPLMALCRQLSAHPIVAVFCRHVCRHGAADGVHNLQPRCVLPLAVLPVTVHRSDATSPPAASRAAWIHQGRCRCAELPRERRQTMPTHIDSVCIISSWRHSWQSCLA